MAVYDEYLKNQNGAPHGPAGGADDAPAQTNGTETLNPSAEEVKGVEA